jgi:hypothetical protein
MDGTNRNMIANFKKILRMNLNKIGLDIVRYLPDRDLLHFPIDFDENQIQIIKKVKPFTATSSERIQALCQAINYIIKNNIPGDIVECGVWKGGSMMAAMLTLLEHRNTSREFYLFDTFEGMTQPGKDDISIGGRLAANIFEEKKQCGEKWVYSSLQEVQQTISSINYDNTKIHYVKGKVEDTLPNYAPDRISLLRLDTDWYESTKHELVHLFPRLSKQGVIIIDDYGEWEGARKAVDEYIDTNNISILLNRIDYTGRIGIKI